jgi:hypothetical protein
VVSPFLGFGLAGIIPSMEDLPLSVSNRAVKFEATPGEPVELDRNGPYSAAKCKRVNEIIRRTPSFATMRSSVRIPTSSTIFQSLTGRHNYTLVTLCHKKPGSLEHVAASYSVLGVLGRSFVASCRL